MERTKFKPKKDAKKKPKKEPRNSVKEENYTTIQGWMITDLKLKGHKLIAYAVIYGFSQDGESKYTGSNSYLGTWLQVTEPTVIKVLKELVEAKLIRKIPVKIKGVTFNEYEHNEETLVVLKKLKCTTKEILGGTTKEILDNSKVDNNKEINNKEINKEKFPFNLFSSELINDKNFQELLIEYIAHRKEKSSGMTKVAWKRLASKLNKFKLLEVCEAMEMTLENGYTGVFPNSNRNNSPNKKLKGGVPAQLEKDHSKYLKKTKYGRMLDKVL